MGRDQRKVHNSIIGDQSQEMQGIRANGHIYALTGAINHFQTGTAWNTHDNQEENKRIEIKRF